MSRRGKLKKITKTFFFNMIQKKLDCQNNRIKNPVESRADKVTSWRVRGNGTIPEVRTNSNGSKNLFFFLFHFHLKQPCFILDRTISISNNIQSIWASIPNETSVPFASTRYGDHQGNNILGFQ